MPSTGGSEQPNPAAERAAQVIRFFFGDPGMAAGVSPSMNLTRWMV